MENLEKEIEKLNNQLHDYEIIVSEKDEKINELEDKISDISDLADVLFKLLRR
jgi:hypothetical protein